MSLTPLTRAAGGYNNSMAIVPAGLNPMFMMQPGMVGGGALVPYGMGPFGGMPAAGACAWGRGKGARRQHTPTPRPICTQPANTTTHARTHARTHHPYPHARTQAPRAAVPTPSTPS
jgi:hypothetical protein